MKLEFSPPFAVAATIALGLCGALASLRAQSGPGGQPFVPTPRPIIAPALDAKIVESREKVNDQKWLASHAVDAGGKKPSAALLGQQISSGDLHAAILKNDADKKSADPASAKADTAAIATLAAQGIAAGDATAFLAKADLDWDKGDIDSAVKNGREASRRGSTAADYKLARFKALKTQKADWPDLMEPALVLLYRAADKGDPDAAREYGLALDRGFWQIDATHSIKCPQAPDQAVAWMERASLLGSPEAAFWLGLHYMKKAEGLVDPARLKALEYLQTVRHAGADLKEPATGKTFAELETAGILEPGLLGEIKRRESKEQSDRVTKAVQKGNPTPIGVAGRKEIDHQVMSIVGDPKGVKPVYNLIGLSPYKEFAQEGAVRSVAGANIVVDQLPQLVDTQGWWVDFVSAGKLLFSIQVVTMDVATNSIGVAWAPPAKLPPNLRFRLVRQHTFLSTFGLDNSAGLKPGSDAASADEVIVYDPIMQVRRRVFFDANSLWWADSGSGQRVNADFYLTPGFAIIVKRTESSALNFQVRGMMPEQAFDAMPRPGVSLVSLRKNNFGANIAGNPAPQRLVAASDLQVVSIGKNHWTLGRNTPSNDWWTAYGIGSSDQVNVVMNSAAVLVNK